LSESDPTISNLQSLICIGSRLYKTGDLARYLPDGNMMFLGRVDHQVKVRGFRVEPGEIEVALGQHAAVREAIVVVREDVPGEKRLIAYIVPRDWGSEIRDSAERNLQSPISNLQSELRAFLKQLLPDYMIPSAFVLLDALPLTPTGKIDRQALPAPELARADMEQPIVMPRTPLEVTLVGIWAEVLGHKQIGIHDNFFELGGHSLLATQLIARLRTALQVELPVRVLFEAPTVAELAERIATMQQTVLRQPAGPIAGATREGPLPLSFAQQRLWFLDQLAPGSPFYNIAAAVQLHGLLDVAALDYGLSALVQRHETLRTTFELHEEQPVQVIAPALPLPLPCIDLQDCTPAQQEQQVRELAEAAAQQPFDLSRGPLIRATILRLAPHEHVLLLTLHHIIADGWSIGVLVREIAASYLAHSSGQPAQLAPLPLQYADYAIWQRQWVGSGAAAAQLAYWKAQLAGPLPAHELPIAQPRREGMSFHGAAQPVALSSDLTAALVALSRQENATLFMTLLAAFAMLLHRYTGDEDIIIGSPIANRTWPELEGLIGFFVNMLPLRIDLSGNPSVRDMLQRVREVCLEAYAHQDLPFDRVIEAVQPWRSASRMPIFSVVLALQNAPLPPIELPGLTFDILETVTATAKYDLTLNVTETSSGLRGALEYTTHLYDQAAIGQLLAHFQTLLEGIVSDPDQPIANLSLVSAAELRRLEEWSVAHRQSAM
jgi:hypothetical protein